MAERTSIEWCDSSWNPWVGCTKVGPGCDHCYAEALMDVRHRRVQWGAGQPRVRTSADNWKAPLAWNRNPFYRCLGCGHRFAPKARKEGFVACPSCTPHKSGFAYDEDEASRVEQVRRRVFCASLADVFDNEVDGQWRVDLFELILSTPNLDWLLLTKRIGNVPQMLRLANMTVLPPNVWLGATVVNQEEADRDIPKLLAVPARVRFLSVEPMLGPIDLRFHFFSETTGNFRTGPNGKRQIECVKPKDGGIHWVIAGGESGHSARPVHPAWVRALRDQCQAAGVPFLMKQWGEFAPAPADSKGFRPNDPSNVLFTYGGPNDNAVHMERVGKKSAGRLLDGREWNGFPEGDRLMVMPWGKHKGKEIDALPSGYLRWLAEECDDDAIATAASDELKWRDDHNAHRED